MAYSSFAQDADISIHNSCFKKLGWINRLLKEAFTEILFNRVAKLIW